MIKGKLQDLNLYFTAHGRTYQVKAWGYNDGGPPFLSVTSALEGEDQVDEHADSNPDAHAVFVECTIRLEDGTQVSATELDPDLDKRPSGSDLLTPT